MCYSSCLQFLRLIIRVNLETAVCGILLYHQKVLLIFPLKLRFCLVKVQREANSWTRHRVANRIKIFNRFELEVFLFQFLSDQFDFLHGGLALLIIQMSYFWVLCSEMFRDLLEANLLLNFTEDYLCFWKLHSLLFEKLSFVMIASFYFFDYQFSWNFI